MNISPEQLYREREKRVNDTIQLQEPDRVPLMCFLGGFPVRYSGITARESMYDYDKVMKAWLNTAKDFQPDMIDIGFGECFIGALLEALDYQALQWPGCGLKADSKSPYQFLEKEFMTADEYDAFLYDPMDFMVRTFWPRIFEALKPLGKLPPLTEIISYYLGPFNLAAFSDPEIKGAFDALFKAGEHAQKLIQGAMEQKKK